MWRWLTMQKVIAYEEAERRHRRKAARAKRGSLRWRWHLYAAGQARRHRNEALVAVNGRRAGWVAPVPVQTDDRR